LIQQTHTSGNKKQRNILSFFFLRDWLVTKMFRKKGSELIISPATVRKNARRLFFIGKHGLVVTTPIVPHPSWPRHGRQKWQEERDDKRKNCEERARIRGKKERGGNVAWCTCGEREKQGARKCVSANNYEDHPSTLSLSFLTPSISLLPS